MEYRGAAQAGRAEPAARAVRRGARGARACVCAGAALRGRPPAPARRAQLLQPRSLTSYLHTTKCELKLANSLLV